MFARALFFLFLLSTFELRAQESDSFQEQLKRHLLVVYNQNNQFARELAFLYANLRGIPYNRILPIDCPQNEIIDRQTYETQIEKPIIDYCKENDWMTWSSTSTNYFGLSYPIRVATRNDIWSIVLIRGIPLKVKPDPQSAKPPQIAPQFANDAVAVDSELAHLTIRGLPAVGMIPNSFHQSAIENRFNADWATKLILVTRLDAPLPGHVEKMIRDSASVEKLGLQGKAIFDARGILTKGYIQGDQWIRASSESFEKAGFDTLLDSEEPLIPVHEPLSDVAVYSGWYTTHLSGFPARSNFQFRPGAIAYHLHSFSASTLRFESKHWAAPLISKGAAAVLGCVYEPYLQFTPNLDIFYQSLLQGQTFAEAAYRSQPTLSWMTTFIGDPLYIPFPATTIIPKDLEKTDPDTAAWLRQRRARLFDQQGKSFSEIEKILKGFSHPVTWEGLAELAIQSKRPGDEIVGAIYQAQTHSNDETQSLRYALMLARYQGKSGNPAQALSTYENIVREHSLWPDVRMIAVEAASLAKEESLSELPTTIAGLYAAYEEEQLLKRQQQQAAEREKKNNQTGETPPPANPFPEAPEIKARQDLIPPKPNFSPSQNSKNTNFPGRLTPENNPYLIKPPSQQ